MVIIKCDQCGERKLIRCQMRDYIFKKKDRKTLKVCYFCSYDCMRKAEKENPDKFVCKRSI